MTTPTPSPVSQPTVGERIWRKWNKDDDYQDSRDFIPLINTEFASLQAQCEQHERDAVEQRTSYISAGVRGGDWKAYETGYKEVIARWIDSLLPPPKTLSPFGCECWRNPNGDSWQAPDGFHYTLTGDNPSEGTSFKVCPFCGAKRTEVK